MRIRIHFTGTTFTIEKEVPNKELAESLIKYIVTNGIFTTDTDFSYYPPSIIGRIDFFSKSRKEEQEEYERSQD